MSLTALVGGTLLYLVLRRYLASGIEGPPLLRHLDSPRLFDKSMVLLCWRAAAGLLSVLGTRRLQPQLRLLVGVALVAGLLPPYGPGLRKIGRAAGRGSVWQSVLVSVGTVALKKKKNPT